MENGVEAIERYVKEHGFKMVQMQANMHAYRPDRALDWVRPCFEKCAELGIPVKLHTSDGPYSIPSEWVPMIKEFLTSISSWPTSACRPAASTCSNRCNGRWNCPTSTASRAGHGE